MTQISPSTHESRHGKISACGITVETGLFSASVGAHRLPLTAREFDLLSLLLNDCYRVVSRDEIRRRIWTTSTVGERVVDTYVCRVRKKLREAGHPGIAAVQKRGYRLLGMDE